MISPARRLCYRILHRIESHHLFSDDALNSDEMERLDVRDRHLTTEIVYGTLRWQALLDYILAKSSSRSWPNVAPGAKILLRMSLYQMWGMDRIPHHALVNDAVELAKQELGNGIDRYLNGVLRNLARTSPWKKDEFLRDTPEWIQVSLPQWLWDRWVERYGKETVKEYAFSLNTPPQICAHWIEAAGTYKQPPMNAVPSDLVPDAYIQKTAVLEGEQIAKNSSIGFHFQDEASQLIPHLLGQGATGLRIWDACAAPGGKASILCKIFGKSGRVIASDVRADRIPLLAETIKNTGVFNADVLIADACQSAPFRACFDAVLADVPCSGLGTLRRNPEKKWRFHSGRLASLQRTQKQILHKVSETVRSGGHLLYSTCSTEPEENEEVIEDFLNTHPGFCIERPTYPPGIETWTGSDSMVRTFPGPRLWDGFFAALLMRRN
jgi:16S rRNA (cytosine967-C5)-methyltransferase